jgi:hypothetical protein
MHWPSAMNGRAGRNKVGRFILTYPYHIYPGDCADHLRARQATSTRQRSWGRHQGLQRGDQRRHKQREPQEQLRREEYGQPTSRFVAKISGISRRQGFCVYEVSFLQFSAGEDLSRPEQTNRTLDALNCKLVRGKAVGYAPPCMTSLKVRS